MKSLFYYLLERAKERSTWTGVATFLTVLGLSLTPEQSAAVATAGVSFVALVFTFMPDPKK